MLFADFSVNLKQHASKETQPKNNHKYRNFETKILVYLIPYPTGKSHAKKQLQSKVAIL
jgi:hypothetical protein